MNPDDYDDDGNNIVPCPICLNIYCPSKENGEECPDEEEFIKNLNKINMKDRILEHIREVCDLKRLEFGCEIKSKKYDVIGRVYLDTGDRIEAMFGDIMDAYVKDSVYYKIIGLPVELNHFLWTISLTEREKGETRLFMDIVELELDNPLQNKTAKYDLRKSVSENLDNEELCNLVAELLNIK